MSFRDKVGTSWDVATDKVTIEGVDIEIRSMSVLDKAKLLKNASKDGEVDAEKWYPWVVLTCCFDPETGERAFTEEDLEWLTSKSSDVVQLLAVRCLSLSAMGSGRVVEEAKKDS